MENNKYYIQHKIKNFTLPVRYLLTQHKEGIIILDDNILESDFNEWTLYQKRLYIEYLLKYGDNRFIQGSLLLLSIKKSNGYLVTKDSYNAVKTIIQFYNNEFSLYENKITLYNDLDEDTKSLFKNAYIYFQNTPNKEVLEELINLKSFLA